MKIIYAGSPQFSIAPLQKLLEHNFEVIAVLTQPDRPVGRKGILTATPLHIFAKEHNIPVYTFERVKNAIEALQQLQADCLITCAYGQILTEQVLAIFPSGVYNIHASLLPRWRGASPVQHALLYGDSQTGITIMKTDVGLDTGDIVLSRTLPIQNEDNATTLFQKLSILGAECIVQAMQQLQKGELTYTKQQQNGVTLCKKIVKSDCLIDFDTSAQEIVQLIKAMEAGPVAFCYLQGQLVNFYDASIADESVQSLNLGQPNGSVLAVQKNGIFVKTGNGILQVKTLQFAGSKKMTCQDIYNSKKVKINQIFLKEEER